MGDKSKIEWLLAPGTQAGATWNVVTGCSKISPGCKHCYAAREWLRLSANPQTVYYGRKFEDVGFHTDRLEQPLHWKKPRTIFVNSMSDLFHDSINFELIDQIFAVMAVASHHTFIVLTKRSKRMLEWSKVAFDSYPTVRCVELERVGNAIQDTDYVGQWVRFPWPLPNVWMVVSIESQDYTCRIEDLLNTPAAVRGISAEPLLGPLDLNAVKLGCGWRPFYCGCSLPCEHAKIDWVIAGGESGPGARPCHPDWIRGLRDQCVDAKVAFFFKQWGEWLHESQTKENLWGKFVELGQVAGNVGKHYQYGGYTYRVGKKAAGHLLDGQTWQQYPTEQR